MDLILRKVRIQDDELPVDVAIEGGRIKAIGRDLPQRGTEEIAGKGKVLVPGFVEAHLHLEKVLIKDRKPNRSGTLQEAIAVTASLKPTFTGEDIHARAKKALFWMLKNGVTHLRAHGEFDPAQGFTGLEVSLALKKEFAGLIDIQVCAFPQEGVIKAPGTEAMMHKALGEYGADVCGGIPYNDTSAEEHIDLMFRIAKAHDKDLDVHQDFKDDMDGMSIEYLARKTIKEGYEGRVSVGHLTALGAVPPDARKDLIRLIADAGISVMCLPATDLHLGGRNDSYNVRRTLTPVRALRDGGVNVCLATNNIRNAFTPYNNGDILAVAYLGVAACHLGGADDLPTVLPMITTNAAKALGLRDYGLEVGKKADLVLLDTTSVGDAVIDMPDRLYVIKNGRVTVKTERAVSYSFA
jgi:cytosine deaminase